MQRFMFSWYLSNGIPVEGLGDIRPPKEDKAYIPQIVLLEPVFDSICQRHAVPPADSPYAAALAAFKLVAAVRHLQLMDPREAQYLAYYHIVAASKIVPEVLPGTDKLTGDELRLFYGTRLGSRRSHGFRPSVEYRGLKSCRLPYPLGTGFLVHINACASAATARCCVTLMQSTVLPRINAVSFRLKPSTRRRMMTCCWGSVRSSRMARQTLSSSMCCHAASV